MEHLDLPELNEMRIRDNAESIRTNKIMVRGLFIMVVWMGFTIGYLINQQHTINNCMSNLYTHITDKDAPSDMELRGCEDEK